MFARAAAVPATFGRFSHCAGLTSKPTALSSVSGDCPSYGDNLIRTATAQPVWEKEDKTAHDGATAAIVSDLQPPVRPWPIVVMPCRPLPAHGPSILLCLDWRGPPCGSGDRDESAAIVAPWWAVSGDTLQTGSDRSEHRPDQSTDQRRHQEASRRTVSNMLSWSMVNGRVRWGV